MNAKAVSAFPLTWPLGWPRTKVAFKRSPGKAFREIREELGRAGAASVVISTNLPTRRDGQPYADARLAQPDPGVAVYFALNGRQYVLACDRFNTAAGNARAIALTVEAMRGIERWGTGGMLERAFTGFLALPEGNTR
jgi:hypothetical protein